MPDSKGSSLSEILNRTTHPLAGPSVSAAEPDEGDPGPCASRAKDRWVTAITIKHAKKAWESFQYTGIGTRSFFTPTKFEIMFLGHEEKWRLTVTGRNLWVLYNLIIQHRLEWLKAADRDFADDKQPIILTAEVTEIKEDKS